MAGINFILLIFCLHTIPSLLSLHPKQAYFILNFPWYTANKFKDQLQVGLVAQLVRALHWYRIGLGSNPGKPEFFQAFFSQPVFLPDCGIVALPHFFGKCCTVISPRGPKGANKEERHITKTFVNIILCTHIPLQYKPKFNWLWHLYCNSELQNIELTVCKIGYLLS